MRAILSLLNLFIYFSWLISALSYCIWLIKDGVFNALQKAILFGTIQISKRCPPRLVNVLVSATILCCRRENNIQLLSFSFSFSAYLWLHFLLSFKGGKKSSFCSFISTLSSWCFFQATFLFSSLAIAFSFLIHTFLSVH